MTDEQTDPTPEKIADPLPPTEPSIEVTFRADGSARMLASDGWGYEQWIKASALFMREANRMLDRAEFQSMMQTQEAAQVAAALRGEKQGEGLKPTLLDMARHKGSNGGLRR